MRSLIKIVLLALVIQGGPLICAKQPPSDGSGSLPVPKKYCDEGAFPPAGTPEFTFPLEVQGPSWILLGGELTTNGGPETEYFYSEKGILSRSLRGADKKLERQEAFFLLPLLSKEVIESLKIKQKNDGGISEDLSFIKLIIGHLQPYLSEELIKSLLSANWNPFHCKYSPVDTVDKIVINSENNLPKRVLITFNGCIYIAQLG